MVSSGKFQSPCAIGDDTSPDLVYFISLGTGVRARRPDRAVSSGLTSYRNMCPTSKQDSGVVSGAGEQGKALKDNADPPPVQSKNISLDREFPCFLFFLFFFGKAYYGRHGAPFLTLGFLCVGTRLRTRPKRITIMITRILLFHLYMDRGIAALEMRCPPGTGFRPRIQQPYQGNRETTSSLYTHAGLDVHSLRR